MSRFSKKTIIATSLILSFAALVIGWLIFVSNNSSPIPKQIKRQLSFSTLTPEPGTLWHSSPKSVSYNTNTGVLAMTATSGTLTIVVTEQAQPQSFSDVPQVYPTLLNKLNQYEDLQTAIGTVTLTHPKELNGGQTAVAILRQTLIFARPSSNLSGVQWKNFFSSMQWS